jgi:hypothetical protein
MAIWEGYNDLLRSMSDDIVNDIWITRQMKLRCIGTTLGHRTVHQQV